MIIEFRWVVYSRIFYTSVYVEFEAKSFPISGLAPSGVTHGLLGFLASLVRRAESTICETHNP